MSQPKYYEPPEEDIQRAVTILVETFGTSLGFPETATRLRLIAKGFCRIVWFLPQTEIRKKQFPKQPEKWTPHEILGDIPDHEWLMERAVEVFDRFPALIDLRRLHDEYFDNRDGREWEEIALPKL